MYKIILLIIFAFTIIKVNAQTTILQEDFEHAGSLPSGWTNEYVSSSVNWISSTGGHSSYPASAHGGTYNALFYSGNYNGDKTKLVSSVINLSGYTGCTLNFYHAQTSWLGDQDSLYVYYKTSAGGTWNLLASYNAEAATWSLRSLSLPNTNSTYYIAFEGNSGYGYGVCIDDVTITGTLASSVQTVLLNSTTNGTTVQTCNSVFYDSGGNSGNYSNSQNYTITFQSGNNSCIRAIIEDYCLEYNYDTLFIYDGSSTAGTLLVALNDSSINTNPAYSRDDHGTAFIGISGYLTFRFKSDGATVKHGWKINIDCPEHCVFPYCSENTAANNSCESATPICNLNGYCGNTGSSYTADHTELNNSIFCGTIENNSWLAFVANSTTAELEIWVRNCTGIGTYMLKHGIQIQIYDTDCSTFTSVSNCWSPNRQANGVVTATGLVIGHTYLIMIDGWGADDCEYSFVAVSGIIAASAGSDKTICEGEYATLTASGGTNVLWTATPADPSLSGQEANMSITVSPGQTTTYTAEVWGSNALCSAPADAVVFVNSASAEFTGLDNAYCSNSSSVTLSGNFGSGVFSGTGMSGSTFSPSSVPPGSTNITYTYNYSVVTAFSDDFDPSPNAGWTSGWSSLGGTGTQGNSWSTGNPKGGRGSSASGFSDPIVDHSSGNSNNVYGQGLSGSSGDGVGGNFDYSQEWLRTPAINCTGLTNTTLSFWRWANLETNWDEAYVKISTNGTTWTDLAEPLYPKDDHWVQRIIDISQYADNKATVYIRWESQSDNVTTWSGWNIDDVSITGVQSGGSCVSTDIQTTYINPTLSATIAAGTAISCYGASNGTATVTPSGGTSPYTYLWSNGQTTATATGLSAGTHYVTVNDSYGVCQSVIKNITINQPSQIALSTSSVSSTCGNSNGSASVSASGGSGGYTYSWNGGGSSATISGKPSGNYSVTVTDSNGCTNSTSVNISDAGAPTATMSAPTNVNCYGSSTGSATVSANGGTAPYSYSWSNGATTATASNLPANNYSVTVTDNTGCKATASVTISQPSELIISQNSKTDVKCYGNSSGAIDLSVSGGTPSYNYSWNSGQSSLDLTNIPAGTYTITVTDNKGCQKNSTISITQPASALSVSITSQTNVLCYGNSTGNATATASGGTPSYTYLWSTPQAGQTTNNLSAGTYYVSVQDGNSCTTVTSATITQPSNPLQITYTTTPITCYGLSNGGINISVTGGTPNYNYLWSNGPTSEDISNIATGNYTITTTDGNGCTALAGINLSQPSQLTASINGNNISCFNANNGTVTASPLGGTSPYTYNWSNGQSLSSISSLQAGNYQVTVTDNNACTTTSSITLTEPSEIIVTTSSTNSSCGSSNGSASVTNVTGGTTPYTYLWQNGNTTSSISNLASGSYNVTVTDANSCTKVASINVNDANAATVSITSSTDVSCNGGSNGSAQVTASGGTAPYTYLWTNGSTSSTVNNFSAGIQSVTVTDGNGCTSSASTTINEPTALSLTTTPINITCNGSNNGQISISVSGGTNPYTYLWSNGATSQNISNLASGIYSVVVTDSHNCTKSSANITITQPTAITASSTFVNASCNGKNDGSINLSVSGGTTPYSYLWSNGLNSQDLNDIVANTYTVTISDANNCTSTNSTTITQPAAITYSTSKTNITCYGANNGAIDLTVSGGTNPYTYLWSNGDATEDLTDIASGSYTVIITDANNCDATASVSITQPTQIITSITGNDVTCNGLSNGNINLTVSGGSLPYNYSWNHGQTSQDLFNIAGGTYEVTITDNYNCSKTESYTINEPASIVITSTATNVSCYQGNDGTVSVVVSGGNQPYSYIWSNSLTDPNLTKLTSGTYTVTVSDVNGCEALTSVTITEPTLLAAFASGTNVSCFGFANGSASVSTVGGTTPYSYSWSNGSNQSTIYSLTPATYTVTISDNNNCKITESVVITEPLAQLSVNINNFSPVLCYGASNGYAIADVTGGTQPYTYNWSDSANQKDSLANNLHPGTYQITITDANSCVDTIAYVTIAEAGEIKYNYISTQTSCNGSKDGMISVSVSGIEKPYKFVWNTDPVKTDSIIKDLAYGSYIVTISDKYNCSVIDTITVLKPDNTCLEIPSCFTPNGDGVNDKFEIKYSELYPDIHVEIYNRWGIMMFKSDGYLEMWDGTYNGKEATLSSYVYIITLGDGSEPITGSVSIVK